MQKPNYRPWAVFRKETQKLMGTMLENLVHRHFGTKIHLSQSVQQKFLWIENASVTLTEQEETKLARENRKMANTSNRVILFWSKNSYTFLSAPFCINRWCRGQLTILYARKLFSKETTFFRPEGQFTEIWDYRNFSAFQFVNKHVQNIQIKFVYVHMFSVKLSVSMQQGNVFYYRQF